MKQVFGMVALMAMSGAYLAGMAGCAQDAGTTPTAGLNLPLTSHPDSSSWRDLIKPDLSNAIVPEGVWTFKDGVLTASADEGIWTKDQYGDCFLDLEFMFEPAANSGVFVYNANLAHWLTSAAEIQICDDRADKWQESPADWHTGAFFGHQAPLKSAVKPAGAWNRMTITCLGPKITVLLNGEVVNNIDLSRWTDAKKNPDGSDVPPWLHGKPWKEMPTKGHIGFQGRHGGAGIFFRNMKVLPLTISAANKGGAAGASGTQWGK